MKKITLISVLLLMFATVSMAQVNMKSGYIVNNQGDTIRGKIDLRTNEQLSTRCTFRAEGSNETKAFKPGEIECFRYDENGKFFVSRMLDVDGNKQMYFAEFIVHGKLNLYCVVYHDEDHYFFEREDGEMAVITNRSIHNMDARDILTEKQKQYGAVKTLLKDSNKAMLAVQGADMSRSKLISIVRDYHNDLCTDGSSCVEYEYKAAADEFKFHIKAFAGYAYYSQESTDQQHFKGESYPGGTAEVGIGLEVEMERLMKGFSIEMGAAFSPKYKSEHDVPENMSPDKFIHSSYEKAFLTFSLGGVKRFGTGKIQPLVRAGGFGNVALGCKEYKYTPYNKQEVKLDWNSSIHFGAYIGAGAQVNLGKHYVRVHGDLYKSLESGSKMTKWGITAEFGL